MELEMNKDTLEKLKEMKLYGMYDTFKASLENYGRSNMTIDKFVNIWSATSGTTGTTDT